MDSRRKDKGDLPSKSLDLPSEGVSFPDCKHDLEDLLLPPVKQVKLVHFSIFLCPESIDLWRIRLSRLLSHTLPHPFRQQVVSLHSWIYLFMFVIQHCFICRPSDSTVSEDAGIEPRTVVT